MTIEKTKGEEEESFVLPMLYDIENSDDEELIPMGAGTLRKKEVNEGKEWEDGSENVPNAAASPASRQRKRKQ
jgi:hypothetical protein